MVLFCKAEHIFSLAVQRPLAPDTLQLLFHEHFSFCVLVLQAEKLLLSLLQGSHAPAALHLSLRAQLPALPTCLTSPAMCSEYLMCSGEFPLIPRLALLLSLCIPALGAGFFNPCLPFIENSTFSLQFVHVPLQLRILSLFFQFQALLTAIDLEL